MGIGSPTSRIQLDLFQAASAGDCARLARLLEAGADVNAYDRWDSTPLYYACLTGHAEAAQMLLEAGAVFAESTLEGARCYLAALNLGMRRLLRSYEARPPPLLASFPAVLKSSFLGCPANRAGAESTPTDAAGAAEPWPVAPDITLYVEGRPIKAHRVILAARSPYFRTKLTTEWRNRKKVTFASSHSLSFELMRSLVEFFYSDRLEVPADDLEALARICKACKCKGLREKVNKVIARMSYRDATTRQLDREYPRRCFLFQGRCMDRAADRLPSALRQILQDCLANSREEELHNNELVETCTSSEYYDDLADVCIKVGDNVFRCHQMMLALRSEYFKIRLARRTDFLERHCNEGELPLLEEHDVSAEAFEKVLEYVYTDELDHLGDDPLTQAEDLLDLASRYLMFGLKRVVADLLLPHLDLGHVSLAQLCRWLVLSDLYDVAKVRKHCLDIVACNLEVFAEAREFRALLLTLPSRSGDDASWPTTTVDGQGDFLKDLRERWFRAAAAGLDRRGESVAMFDELLEMLVLAAEQEANDGSNV